MAKQLIEFDPEKRIELEEALRGLSCGDCELGAEYLKELQDESRKLKHLFLSHFRSLIEERHIIAHKKKTLTLQ